MRTCFRSVAANHNRPRAVRRFGSVQGAALEACAGVVIANAVNSDPRAMREEEDILQVSQGAS